jgi:hypothetical protein
MDIPAFISHHLDHINAALNIFIIIMIILTFSVGGATGALAYTYLILSLIAGLTSVSVSVAHRYGYMVPSSGFPKLQ